MKNANRNMILAAAAALTLAVAPSAPADVRVHVNLPIPPPPHEVLRHVPPPPPIAYRYDARWNYANRHRNDYWAWVGGRWVARPYLGAVWVDGYYDRWGRWVPGYWARARYR